VKLKLSSYSNYYAVYYNFRLLKDENSEKINKGKTRSTSASPSAASSSINSINNNNTGPTTTKRCPSNEALSDLPDRNHKSASKILGQNTQNTTKDKEFTSADDQILQLTNVIASLQEKERSLEQQLSKYQGMQEQENTIRELESKLKICKVETMIYNMKIETLKIDNQRLQTYEDDTKVKIKTLKKKLKEVEEENGILAGLHRKVSILHEDKLRKLIDQENKCLTLQKKNSELLSENSDLLKKLELALHKSSEVINQRMLLRY
jgi:chromosome segregation ATPase